jgi:hypothetical protein
MSEVYPFAKTAEDVYIQGTIGTKLYVYLKDVVVASKASPPSSISTNDRTLLEYLRDALLWYTLYDAIPFLGTKIRNIGIVKQNGDNLETADRSDVTYLRNECLNKGQFYLNQVKRYLCEYDSLYSEYKCDSWNINPNELTADNSGISFDRSTKTNIDYDFIRKWFSA